MDSLKFQLTALIEAMNDKPIAFNRHYVRLGCGITGALMLSQMIYWSKRTSNSDGSFYKTQDDWEEETGLTRREQETARRKLRELGFLVEVKRGVPCKIYFKIDNSILYDKLIQYAQERHLSMAESDILGCTKPTASDGGKRQPITENTTEITTESKLSTAELTEILKGKKPVDALIRIGLEPDVAKRFNDHRKAIRKNLTLDAVIKMYHESCNAGISTNYAARIVLSESWQGFASRYNWQATYDSLRQSDSPAQQADPQAPQQQINLPSKPKGFLGGAQ